MADINVEYINVFLKAAAQVMKDVCQMNLSIGRPYVKQTEFENETVVVNIGITGRLRGLVLLAMPKEVACDIASRMCFMTIEKLDEISLSALSEMGNMIFGNAAYNTAKHHTGKLQALKRPCQKYMRSVEL